MSIWDCDKPLDAMMLSHDHMAILVMKHEKEIQELKRLVTPMMEFKQQMPTKIVDPNLVGVLNAAGFYKKEEWVGLTDAEKQMAYLKIDTWDVCVSFIEAKLKEKNRSL